MTDEAPDYFQPEHGLVLTHLLISRDVDRSREFYRTVLGATVVRERQPAILRLHNGYLVINDEGGPTDDKPTVRAQAPADPDVLGSALNVRVTDVRAVYELWRSRGGQFLTEPKDHGMEIRCYLRDPDGYLIELGQATGILAELGRAAG
ncbi:MULTISPECIES: VOC family protein [Micromonospora]|uniref:VOC family protein n=1 Tax=Micromonospora solifontis TaxID=2487138 RepID=A0ABX9WFK2_9ACTN|nr:MULTISPECIES: VOC family protein [Micromonospora]NES15100.1 VOC family protein [Micromonospora sp. PPF5-17B]NES37200.1 VOC family protein [Micromonospora solifontis]NES56225.1 VOC family protein [Micromonospora sp. PPF5-6]RNL98645.1 VOC family protein [Micromonospora solifontis]